MPYEGPFQKGQLQEDAASEGQPQWEMQLQMHMQNPNAHLQESPVPKEQLQKSTPVSEEAAPSGRSYQKGISII